MPEPTTPEPTTPKADIAVIGGGPAADAAARAAAGEERKVLRLAVAASADVERAWTLERAADGAFEIGVLAEAGVATRRAGRVVAVAEPRDRIAPYPGWTDDAASGHAALCDHARAGALRPGERVLVVGQGPLARQAADLARAAGADVLDVIETATPPRLQRTGATLEIEIEDHAFLADRLAAGWGVAEDGRVAALLGAAQIFDRAALLWRVARDASGRTSAPGVYAVAADDAPAGARAGRAAALDPIEWAPSAWAAPASPPEPASAFWRGAVAAFADDLAICPCERLTRGEIERACADGAADLNQLKQFTRCGMGPCQGRLCAEPAAMIAAAALVGSDPASPAAAFADAVERLGVWTPRPPLSPVSLAQLIGDFTYDDIPIPPPAPL